MTTEKAGTAQRSAPIAPTHGSIATPKSRATFAEERRFIDGNLHNGIESGKFFPETTGGLTDPYAKDDVTNIAPPADGKIASGERPGAAYLDKTDVEWDKHDVASGASLDFVWSFSARHKYRRFNYFITKADWNAGEPLTRAQFEPQPFATFLNELQPYWGFTDEQMWPAQPTTHTLKLPERQGYHVLLGVWEIAETDKAFYQVVDLNFVAK
ncbi:lytic polysaccharide monooxygenase auxiliary activity family 9 protein [Pseudomonas sp. WHRI 8519]|uniref:lytic polysaccharide monooxygenase auxiliary activity family 9 protein n=1 Tax=Pseudomonas sp. WHRI 8519 TaxID=3162567 RepID=UPI0032ED4647